MFTVKKFLITTISFLKRTFERSRSFKSVYKISMVNIEIFGGGLGIKTTKSHMKISIFWTKPLLTFIYTYRRHKSVWAIVTSRTLPGYEQLYTQFSRCQRSEILYSPYLYNMCIIWTPGSLPLESASTRFDSQTPTPPLQRYRNVKRIRKVAL